MLTEREGPSRYEMDADVHGSDARLSSRVGGRLAHAIDFIQRPPEARVRLRHHLLVRDRDVAAGEAGDGEGHGDAVVVVRLDRGGVGRSSRAG